MQGKRWPAMVARGRFTRAMALLFIISAVTFVASAAFPRYRRSSARQPASGPAPVRPSRVADAYGKLPLSFEANRGQTDAQVQFLSRGSGYSLFLNSTEAVLKLQRSRKQAVNPTGDTCSVLRMKLVGANPLAEGRGIEELPGKSNYFIGKDSSQWHTNIPTYAKVLYKKVYAGIDLLYYGNPAGAGQLEYDFAVGPGADPRAIRLAIQGHEDLRIDAGGDLVLEFAESQLRLHRPIVYQQINGVRQSVAGNFVSHGSGQVGFEVAPYDGSKPLIIDPTLSYSTYLGGSSNDAGHGIAVDSSGNAYLTGWTASANFPTAAAFQAAIAGTPTTFDAFVTKLNAAGSALVYSTYLGGSSNDNGYGIAVDSSGNAYVAGSTLSTDFPTVNAFQSTHGADAVEFDAFLTKLNATGSALLYSTYLGGTDYDWGDGVAVDSSGNAYVTGATISTDFPTMSPFQSTNASGGNLRDAFVAKINTNASGSSSLIYSTYLGGSGSDGGTGIAVDSSGNAYVTGYAASGFPTGPNPVFQKTFGGGSSDAFVAKFTSTGSRTYITYLGGSGNDGGAAIAVDSSGNVYITGYTTSTNFPPAGAFQAANGGGQDVFLTKLASTGRTLVYSTYLGGSGNDLATGIALDSSGNAYLTGYTASTNFPTASPVQAANGGNFDAFVTKFNAAGSALTYSTYLGGSSNEHAFGIAVDASGNAYVTGKTNSTNFPTANAFRAASGGNDDVFVTKVSP